MLKKYRCEDLTIIIHIASVSIFEDQNRYRVILYIEIFNIPKISSISIKFKIIEFLIKY